MLCGYGIRSQVARRGVPAAACYSVAQLGVTDEGMFNCNNPHDSPVFCCKAGCSLGRWCHCMHCHQNLTVMGGVQANFILPCGSTLLHQPSPHLLCASVTPNPAVFCPCCYPAHPAALNVHTLATLYNNKEGEMGAMLFWQYLCCIVTLPAALSFFLWLLNTPVMAV